MKFNQLLKGITGLACLSSVAFASDCENIREYLLRKTYSVNILEECIENDKGEVTTLKINNVRSTLSQQNINDLTSYKSLNVFQFKYSQEYLFNIQHENGLMHGDYLYDSDINIIVTGDRNEEDIIPEIVVPNFEIDELPNLTEFNLINYSFHNVYYNPYVYGWFVPKLSKIPADNILKLPKSLKKLYIEGVELNQDYIDVIGTLTDLKELYLNSCDLKGLKLDSLKNIPTITIEDHTSTDEKIYGSIPPNVLSQLTGVKELTLKHIELDGYMIKEIGELTNLEKLNLKKCIEIRYYGYMSARPACMYEGTKCYDMQKHDINWDELKNLTKLKSLNYDRLSIPEEVVKDIKGLKVTSNAFDIQGEYYELLERQDNLRTTIYEKYVYNVNSVFFIEPSEILASQEDLVDDSTETTAMEEATETSEVSEDDDESNATDAIEINENDGTETVIVTEFDDSYTGTASETEDEEEANTDAVNESECPKGDALGYDCCSHCHSIYEDEDGLWGIEHKHWCVIPDHCHAQYEECWSIKEGYPCCDHCKVHLTDKDGQWGIMNKNWCGIPTTCN